VNAQQITRLEGEIDMLNAELAPLRTSCSRRHPRRRLSASGAHHLPAGERVIVELKDSGEEVSAEVMSYINRLSDFLFVASRYLNDKGARDVLWVPGANR